MEMARSPWYQRLILVVSVTLLVAQSLWHNARHTTRTYGLPLVSTPHVRDVDAANGGIPLEPAPSTTTPPFVEATTERRTPLTPSVGNATFEGAAAVAAVAAVAAAAENDRIESYANGSESGTVPHRAVSQVASSRATAFLPLTDWERDSQRDDNRTCAPPPGTPDYCCFGSSSAGGAVKQSSHCRQSQSTYAKMQTMALDAMVPLPDTNTVQCDWCRIIDVLWQYNWTLALQGDSVTRQTFAGIECELRRRSDLYRVELHQTYTVAGPKPRWRYGIDQVYELHVTSLHDSNHTENDTEPSTHPPHTAILRYYAVYRPLLNRSETETFVARGHNDILIVDHGLHYGVQGGDDLFYTEMKSLLQTLLYSHSNERRPWKLLAWRETSAQHFNTTGGHYRDGVGDDGCVALDTVPPDNHITRLFHTLLAHMNVSSDSVALVPFWDYTRPLHELHSTSNNDCTHYCSTPSVWLPLFRNLRLAVDAAVQRWESH